jgi:hypothetical protein
VIKKSFHILISCTICFVAESSALAFTAELKEIQMVIKNVVETRVLWSNGHPFCQRGGLLGAYIGNIDTIIMCQENHNRDYDELVRTLKHEGWHAVQAKCNQGKAALSDEQIRAHLQHRDRRNLHEYHPRQHRAEAEARVVEQIPTPNWIRGVKTYCQGK